jgi:predicted nucleic acid-binding protein
VRLNLRKLRIYLDTSVISNLIAEDAPKMMEYSLRLWDEIKEGIYDVYISSIVLTELGVCPEPKRSNLLKYIEEIDCTQALMVDEAVDLARQYIDKGIIPVKYEDDALHIALATILDCSVIISWNFTHMVKLKTINGVNNINSGFGYRQLEIVSPMSIVSEEED